jgi:hypothetical protein
VYDIDFLSEDSENQEDFNKQLKNTNLSKEYQIEHEEITTNPGLKLLQQEKAEILKEKAEILKEQLILKDQQEFEERERRLDEEFLLEQKEKYSFLKNKLKRGEETIDAYGRNVVLSGTRTEIKPMGKCKKCEDIVEASKMFLGKWVFLCNKHSSKQKKVQCKKCGIKGNEKWILNTHKCDGTMENKNIIELSNNPKVTSVKRIKCMNCPKEFKHENSLYDHLCFSCKEPNLVKLRTLCAGCLRRVIPKEAFNEIHLNCKGKTEEGTYNCSLKCTFSRIIHTRCGVSEERKKEIKICEYCYLRMGKSHRCKQFKQK